MIQYLSQRYPVIVYEHVQRIASSKSCKKGIELGLLEIEK